MESDEPVLQYGLWATEENLSNNISEMHQLVIYSKSLLLSLLIKKFLQQTLIILFYLFIFLNFINTTNLKL